MTIRLGTSAGTGSGRDEGRLVRVVIGAVVASVVALVCWLNLAAPADRLLSDARFGSEHHPVSGDVAFLAIDSVSIDRIGVWPWPRSVYAALIDRLIDLNAQEVWIDVDFSAASTEPEDAALEAALEAAGGYVHLAAFRRFDGNQASLALPLERFAEHARAFSVNVVTDEAGIVRLVTGGISDGQNQARSLVSVIADNGEAFHSIDYGIAADTIPVMSAISLLDGTVEGPEIAGRHIVIGASALELGDYFYTPGQGPLPGAVIQILAAETAIADRDLLVLSNWWSFAALAILLSILIVLPIPSAPLRAVCLGLSSLVVETLALILYQSSAIILPTAAFHLGLTLHLLGSLIVDARLFERLAQKMGGERDAFRAMLEQAIADNYDGILVVRSDGRIVSASKFAERFLGRQLIGNRMQEVLPPEIASNVRTLGIENAQKKGQLTVESALGPRHIEYVLTFSASGVQRKQITTLTFRDITDRIRNEQKLVYLVDHDPITKTLSRSGFTRRVNEELVRPGFRFGILVVQMERFRAVTASLGHEAGDQVLLQFAERLLACGIGPVAHLGQAQFALAAHVKTPAHELFETIKQTSMTAFSAAGHSVMVGVSAGYATAALGDTPQQCLRRAEAALISDGRALGKLALYDHAQSARLSRNRWIETQLARAHQENQFFLLFQPQVDLRAGSIIGAESLIRWRRDGETISPADFLHVAEETGLIVQMTRWILLEACNTAMTWPDPMRVAVNISALHFELGDLLADVTEALALSGLPARRLEIEITETTTVDMRQHTIAVLQQLRKMGITVAIDDFGTGQSSLAYLDQLPFDLIKIDKSFVDRLGTPSAPTGIVSAILGIAGTMGKKVIAEGVEHEQQAEILARLGCDFGQGYYWGKPEDGALLAKQVA